MHLLTAATPKCEEKHDWLQLGTHPGDFPEVPRAFVGFYLVMAEVSVKKSLKDANAKRVISHNILKF